MHDVPTRNLSLQSSLRDATSKKEEEHVHNGITFLATWCSIHHMPRQAGEAASQTRNSTLRRCLHHECHATKRGLIDRQRECRDRGLTARTCGIQSHSELHDVVSTGVAAGTRRVEPTQSGQMIPVVALVTTHQVSW